MAFWKATRLSSFNASTSARTHIVPLVSSMLHRHRRGGPRSPGVAHLSTSPITLHGGHSHASPDDGIDDKDLAAEARRITIVGGGVNLGLTAGTAIVGMMSGSSSLVAHAVHSLSDLISDLISLVSLKLAASEPDAEHPFGYGHYETVGTLGVSGLLVLAGVEVGHEAVASMFAVASVSIKVK